MEYVKNVEKNLMNKSGKDKIKKSGINSAVEYELPKLGVAGSNPVSRSKDKP